MIAKISIQIDISNRYRRIGKISITEVYRPNRLILNGDLRVLLYLS